MESDNMLYTTFKIGDKELKLRLDARRTVELEKSIGTSLLTVMMSMVDVETGEVKNVPDLSFLVKVLHYSLQKYEHGYDIDKTYDLVDEFYDNGGNQMELMSTVIEVLTNALGLTSELEKENK